MLQALRGGAKSPIMKVFLVFLAGGFALWGVGDMTTGLIGGSDKAISAGDQSLSPREVAMEFDRARRSYLPNATVGEALQSGLLSEVTGALARDVVFGAEAQKLGIAVTRDMQRYAVANEPSFKDELGDFSQFRFISILANAGMSEEEYLNQIETTLRRAQIRVNSLRSTTWDLTRCPLTQSLLNLYAVTSASTKVFLYPAPEIHLQQVASLYSVMTAH